MDHLWNALTSSGPAWAWFSAALFIVHVAGYWGAHAVFQLLHRAGALKRFQIAGGAAPPADLMARAYRRAIANTITFAGAALLVYGALKVRGVDFSAPLPSLVTVAWQLAAFALITDTSFYWIHRTLHRPFWFSRVHKQHHEFRFVRGISAEYSNTLEDFGNLITSFLGPVLLGAHPATVLLWFFLRMLETIEAHSGYAFPFTPWTDRHAYHHEFNRGNFGAFLSVWDRLLGTDKSWREWSTSRRLKQP